ncbi:hypothetical protein DH2020_050055 [Rehmannia glutinosa]|uniref:Uncharacterized protein n=1 Tax=Rehmannia glutinosa TaxID=99300 RepID=A0ABR0U137_REHGL
MGRIDYLAMKSDQETAALLDSDFNELKIAAKKLINHATKFGGLAFGTSFLRWVASFAAIFPQGEVGKWIAFVAVVLRLFFPTHFPGFPKLLVDWYRLVGDAGIIDPFAGGFPNFFAYTMRDHWVGVAICLAIGCYLLQEHIRASGGFETPSLKAMAFRTRLALFSCWCSPSGLC